MIQSRMNLGSKPSTVRANRHPRRASTLVRASLPRGPLDALANNIEDPILRAAVKEPAAFWGGVFAGVLRLNVDQDPLKTWVERTSSQAQQAATGRRVTPPSANKDRQ